MLDISARVRPNRSRDPAERDAAAGRCEKRHRTERAAAQQSTTELAPKRRQHEREERDVEGIEHPAKACGNHGAPAVRGALTPPSHRDHRDDPATAATVTPARSSPLRMARASACAPGVSPCAQIVSTCMASVDPSVAIDFTIQDHHANRSRHHRIDDRG